MSRRAILPTVWLGFLLFVAPLKLGNSASARWGSFFPASFLELVLSPWPATFAPVFAGIALLLVAVTAQPPRLTDFVRLRHLFLPLLFLVLASLIGLVNSTTLGVATSFSAHLLSVLVVAVAVFLHLRSFPSTRRVLLICWLVGLAFLVFQIFYQVHYAFAQVDAELQYRIDYENLQVPSALLANVRQGRAMAFFAISNSLAAHLILVIPLVLVLIWNWCKKVDPPLLSQTIFTLLTALLLGYCFYATKSRAAFVAVFVAASALGAMLLCANTAFMRKHWLMITCIASIALLGMFPAYRFIQGKRPSVSSLLARVTYWRTAMHMYREHPVLGAGTGEFFHAYMANKPPGAEETRLPHSVFYLFLSQSGTLGGIAALYFVISILLVWRQVVRKELAVHSQLEFYAVCAGVLAWMAHSLVDFNIHVPATVMLVPILILLSIDAGQSESEATTVAPQPAAAWGWRTGLIALAILAVAQGWKLPGERAFQILDNKLSEVQAQPELLAEDLQRAADLLPLSPHPWLRMGSAYLRSGRFGFAERAYREAIKREPRYASAHFHLAESLFLLGRLDEAEAELRIAVSLYPHEGKYTDLWRQIQKQKSIQREIMN